MTLKIMRYELMRKHTELVKTMKLGVARNILHFLYKKYVILGLSDDANETEEILSKMGFHVSYSRNGNKATVYYQAA